MIGVDIEILHERAHDMVATCGNEVGVRGNPAVQLGAVLAGLARAGRDKVTLVLSEKIRALASRIQQLLAESLGKDGTGLVPVADEPRGSERVRRRPDLRRPSCSKRAHYLMTRPSRSSRTRAIRCCAGP